MTSVDRSPSAIEALTTRKDVTDELRARLKSDACDVRQWNWPKLAFDLVVAVTLLDHLVETEVNGLVQRFLDALRPNGYLFLQVHTVDDSAVTLLGPRSEFASEIKHYFKHNEQRVCLLIPRTRVLSYEERIEWDYDHGEPHQHGFALFFGQIKGGHHGSDSDSA